MSSTAPIPPIPPAARTPKKRARSKVTGPSVSDLIVKAVTASKERSGVSLVALKRSLAASGYDVVKNNARVNLAIKRLVTKGGLVQTKGSGASGSFKASKKQVVAKKKPIKKKRPTKAKKPKKGKRPAAKKTGAAKKSTRKPRKKSAAKKAKSPKKAKKPRAKKAKTTKAKPKATKRKSTRAKAAAP